MQNRQIVIWALLTVVLAGVLFGGGIQIAGRLETQGGYAFPYTVLVLPAAILVQALWFVLGIYFSRRRKRPAVLTGMACGIVCEAVVIFGLILYAASGRY
jgi:hypothetical protein